MVILLRIKNDAYSRILGAQACSRAEISHFEILRLQTGATEISEQSIWTTQTILFLSNLNLTPILPSVNLTSIRTVITPLYYLHFILCPFHHIRDFQQATPGSCQLFFKPVLFLSASQSSLRQIKYIKKTISSSS